MEGDLSARLLTLATSEDLAHRLQAVALVESMGWPPKPHYPGWRVVDERRAWLRVDGAAAVRTSPKHVVIHGPNGYRREIASEHPSLIGSVDYLERVERYG